jgi:hypothetical protein
MGQQHCRARCLRVVFADERIAARIERPQPHGALTAARDHLLDLERHGIEFLGKRIGVDDRQHYSPAGGDVNSDGSKR